MIRFELRHRLRCSSRISFDTISATMVGDASALASGGAGIFKDAQSDALIRTAFFGGSVTSWQFAIPDFGTVQGPFQVTSLEYTGNHDGEVTFEIALESAGAIAFAAA